MSLWSIHNKPKYLSATDLANTAATSSGWVLTKNGHTETLVAIGNLTTKQIPVMSSITTDKASYVLGTDLTMVFTVSYNYPITTTITSASVLAFTIGTTALTAAYDTDSKTETTLSFTYTFPTATVDLVDLIAAGTSIASVSVDDITLDGVEVITLDNANYVDADAIDVNLLAPRVVAVVSCALATPAYPTIISISTLDTTNIIGTDTTIDFLVTFNTNVDSLAPNALTSTTKLFLKYGLLATTTQEAVYASKTARTLTFTYTFPVLDATLDTLLTEGTSSTTITFGDIVIGSGKKLTKAGSSIDARLIVPTTPINVSISRP